MERTARRLRCAAPVLLAALPLPVAAAQAQSGTCRERLSSVPAQAAMYDVAWVTAERLDALDGVEVVIAARGGQDLSRYGLRHSHLAFLLCEGDGRWRAIHLLNRCKTDHSQLYREGLSNFIGESGGHTDLRIGVPVPAVRAALQAMLQPPAIQPRVLHEPKYNVAAYPFATDFQNSNQWVLEVLDAAIAQANGQPPLINRTQAQQWLRTQDYRPSVLHLGLGKRLGARLFVANATTTDHPAGERISGNYSVVTVESVFDFLRAGERLQQEFPIPHAKVEGAAPPAP
ncbi:MAG: hypothetical protein GAK31_03252 [Stenotrophomonas maltophilia]|uniref:DUF2145 domain-containing protein n=1 Tax=Stenotrophomonas maltophilia TaxID=40324 RepID=A0A7V8FF66_STEMA|nr:MAG: hypothetical protein GAK31_03252 [Stenotrophomonas maltophilia]